MSKMNIYLMVEDGESFCIKAEDMGKAVSVCLERYLDIEAHEDPLTFDRDTFTNYYHTNILESCSLVGELKN